MLFSSEHILAGHSPLSMTLLGSTGSIGEQTLSLIDRHFADTVRVKILAAGSNAKRLIQQVKQYKPEYVALADIAQQDNVRHALEGSGTRLLMGQDAVMQAAQIHTDITLCAISGFQGLAPTLAAAKRGTILALANKETIVAGGGFFMQQVAESKSVIIPLDSEHHSAWRCLACVPASSVHRLILTASGGGLRDVPQGDLQKVKPEQALCHPNWSMGSKITIDSATLMNKGLEIIEAHYLFQDKVSDITAWLHPQSIVHALIEHCDGSLTQHASLPDMALPINYALSQIMGQESQYTIPRLPLPTTLDFNLIDTQRYPCFQIAMDVYRERNHGASIVMNAVNEEAVYHFLMHQIAFTDIAVLVEEALQRLDYPKLLTSLDDIIDLDKRARVWVRHSIQRNSKIVSVL